MKQKRAYVAFVVKMEQKTGARASNKAINDVLRSMGFHGICETEITNERKKYEPKTEPKKAEKAEVKKATVAPNAVSTVPAVQPTLSDEDRKAIVKDTIDGVVLALKGRLPKLG